MNFRDQISIEIDRRKLQKLVDDGITTWDEIANAPVYMVRPSCECDEWLEGGEVMRCPKCGAEGIEVEM